MTANPDSTAGTIPATVAWLGALGIAPFAFGSMLAIVPETADAGRTLVLGYGAVILSFLGGTQWGVGLKTKPRGWLAYVVAVVLSLIGWTAMLAGAAIGLPMLAVGFGVALAFDVLGAASVAQLPGWYVGLRALLTLCVLICIGVAAWPLLT